MTQQKTVGACPNCDDLVNPDEALAHTPALCLETRKVKALENIGYQLEEIDKGIDNIVNNMGRHRG
jgi:hypothetical protein